MSRPARKPEPTPDRYLSVSSDPRDTRCEACDGLGTLRLGPGFYQPCGANGCIGGKVAPRGNYARLWRVIQGAMPECRDGDLDDALVTFMLHDRSKTPQADIPVWDGDAGEFTTLGAYLPAPYAVDARVRAYSIGHARSFPGVVTETTKGGAFVKTEGRPDGDGPTFYPTRYLSPEA